jgi:hypothetical protein
MRLADRAVVFLDFDGVLHPVGVPAVDEDFRLIENPGLFVWLPILERFACAAPYGRDYRQLGLTSALR